MIIASEWQVTALRSGGKYRAFREWASRQDPPAALRRLAEELCTSFRVGKVVEEADERLMNHHACKGKSRVRKVRAAGQLSDKEADAGLVSCPDGNPGLQPAGHHSRTEHQQASEQDDVQDQRFVDNRKSLETDRTARQEASKGLQDGQSTINNGGLAQTTSTLINTTLGELASSLPDLFGLQVNLVLHCPSSDYPSALISNGHEVDGWTITLSHHLGATICRSELEKSLAH